jgi:glycosyltransferase 2 family protein
MVAFDRLQRSILISLGLGLIVAIALGLFSDIRLFGEALQTFRWAGLPLILTLTLLNYALRWAKWDYFLRRLGQGGGVGYGDSVLLFLSGMVMSVTPAKIGEVLKSYLLRRLNGTPISASAPIVLAERLTDGLAMLLLMALGLTLYPPARPAFAALVVLTLAGVLILQQRALCERILALVARFPLSAKLAPRLLTVYESTSQLLDWRVLLISTALSVFSWGFECLAFYYVLTGLGIPASTLLLQQATFIFAASTLLGIVSFLPGGLGASEVSSAGLLVLLIPMSASDAAVATLIIRFCTLWFGVAVGIIALLWFGRRYGLRAAERPT